MNWSEYNKNLVKRGNINLWISEDIEKWWYIKQNGKHGRPHVYSDKAIETCLTIGHLFKVPLRMVEGFMNSFFEREQLDIMYQKNLKVMNGEKSVVYNSAMIRDKAQLFSEIAPFESSKCAQCLPPFFMAV